MGNALRQGDRRQFFARVEGTIANLGNALRQRDGLQVFAVRERRTFNCAYARWDHDLRNPLISLKKTKGNRRNSLLQPDTAGNGAQQRNELGAIRAVNNAVYGFYIASVHFPQVRTSAERPSL